MRCSFARGDDSDHFLAFFITIRVGDQKDHNIAHRGAKLLVTMARPLLFLPSPFRIMLVSRWPSSQTCR